MQMEDLLTYVRFNLIAQMPKIMEIDPVLIEQIQFIKETASIMNESNFQDMKGSIIRTIDRIFESKKSNLNLDELEQELDERLEGDFN